MAAVIGVFEILDDDGGKFPFRSLVVRCTVCGTVAERLYKSVSGYSGEGCIHCPRALEKTAVVAELAAAGSLTVLALARRRRHSTRYMRELLAELLREERVIRYIDEGRANRHIYEATT